MENPHPFRSAIPILTNHILYDGGRRKRKDSCLHYERPDAVGSRLSPGGKRDGDSPQEQRALYRGQQRDRQRESKNGHKTKGMSGKPIATEAPYGYVKDPDNKDFWIIDEEA